MQTDKPLPTRTDIIGFLDSQILCTVSSIGEDGYPNAASVAFSSNDKLEFIMGTNAQSRKAANIARSNKVALTITDQTKMWTVQLEGDAEEISWDEFESKFSAKHYEKLPFSRAFKDMPGQTNYVVRPVHLKLTEADIHPWRVTDVSVDAYAAE